MSKTRMMCPFSGKLCAECSLYRGRHYFLCFYEKYRGHLGEGDSAGALITSHALSLKSTVTFEIPLVKPRSAIDPFTIILKEGEKEY